MPLRRTDEAEQRQRKSPGKLQSLPGLFMMAEKVSVFGSFDKVQRRPDYHLKTICWLESSSKIVL